MDGIDFVRQIVRLRAEDQARTRFAVLWQSELATTEATAADCVECSD